MHILPGNLPDYLTFRHGLRKIVEVWTVMMYIKYHYMYICTQYPRSTCMYLCSLILNMQAPVYFYVHSFILPST